MKFCYLEPKAISRADFRFLITAMCTRNPNFGIQPLDDGLLLNLMFYANRGLCRSPYTRDTLEKGSGRDMGGPKRVCLDELFASQNASGTSCSRVKTHQAHSVLLEFSLRSCKLVATSQNVAMLDLRQAMLDLKFI